MPMTPAQFREIRWACGWGNAELADRLRGAGLLKDYLNAREHVQRMARGQRRIPADVAAWLTECSYAAGQTRAVHEAIAETHHRNLITSGHYAQAMAFGGVPKRKKREAASTKG